MSVSNFLTQSLDFPTNRLDFPTNRLDSPINSVDSLTAFATGGPGRPQGVPEAAWAGNGSAKASPE